MAKSQGVAGWHTMRKEDLVRALVLEDRRKKKRGQGLSRVAAAKRQASREAARKNDAAVAKLLQLRRMGRQNLALSDSADSGKKNSVKAMTDRVVVMVRDPYWLHAYWELSSQSIQRACMALGQNWHGAKPVLRLICPNDGAGGSLNREIEIHGGVNNWYIDVQDPPCEYRVEIGYVAANGEFYCLAKSNTVMTPPAGSSESVDENWADIAENADRIFAMSGGYSSQGTSLELQELLEERLQRPLGSPLETRYGGGAANVLMKPEDLQLAIDAELVIYGISHPNAHLTVQGEPVKPQADGTFTVRLSMPDRRQVIPLVASSPDGSEQRTIVLAIERNTKVMEPMHRDPAAVAVRK